MERRYPQVRVNNNIKIKVKKDIKYKVKNMKKFEKNKIGRMYCFKSEKNSIFFKDQNK